MENKFKIGDRVRIRAWDDMEKEFGINRCKSINCQINFAENMRHLCGETARIKNIKSDGQLALERLIKNELSVGDIVTVTDLKGCYPRYTDWILKYAPEYAVFFKFDTSLLAEPDELPYTIRVMSPHIKDTDTQLCLIQRNELIPEKGPCYIVAAKALKKVPV